MEVTITLTPAEKAAEKAIVDWLQKQADEANIEVKMHVDLIQHDEGWIDIPMYVVTPMDGHKKARFMQKIEDSWNFQDPDKNPELRVLITPASE